MEYINAWLENFERQSLIRRALIVSGNIIDLSFSATGQLQPINQIITETLKTGFSACRILLSSGWDFRY